MSNFHKNNILFSILIVVPLGGMGIDLYAAGMPSLAEYLNIDQVAIKTTLSIFLVGLFIGMLSCGILSDHYGRKPFQIINTIIFILSSLVIAQLHNFELILIFRMLQGISAGGLQIVARSMLTDAFSKREITKNSLYVTSIWGLGPIIAPWIGGILTHHYGWQACFYFFSIYGLIVISIYIVILEETNLTKKHLKIKQLQKDCVAIVADKNFIIPVLMLSLAYSSLICYGISGPYFIEKILGLSPISYGNIGLIIGCGYLLGTLACRFLLGFSMTEENLIKFSIYGTFTVNIVMLISVVFLSTAFFPWIFNILCNGFGMGLIYPLYMAKTMKSFPGKAGIASGLIGSTMLLVTSFFSFILTFININTSIKFTSVYLVFISLIFSIWICSKKLHS